jgi:glutathione S-transferase
MNPIRLVHIPRFRSTRAVWMFQELKAIYGTAMPPLEISTFTDIASFRTSKPQWLLDINPNGKVPSMQHGEVSMFEGGAIASYLLHQYDHRKILLPPDPAIVAMYYLFVSWTASTLDTLTATSGPLNIVLDKSDPTKPIPRPMDDVETNQKYFDEVFAPHLEKILYKSGGPYLCGATFTAADVIIGYNILNFREKMEPAWIGPELHPVIFDYYNALCARQGLQFAIGEVPASSK